MSSTAHFLRRKFLLVVVAAFATAAAIIAQLEVPPAPTEASSSFVQSPRKQPVDTIDRETSNPYTGSLSTFEDPKRDQKLQINRVMDILRIKEGSNVADIGAGSGWFTIRAAKRVGTSAIVYAVDINRDYVKHIEKRAQREGLANIRTIVGKEDDPLLPEKSVDAVLLLKTYHEIAEPVRLLTRTRLAMRPGALLGIIDRNGKGDDHGIDRDVVVEEAERAGFVLVEEHDFVKPDDVDYFLVLRAQ